LLLHFDEKIEFNRLFTFSIELINFNFKKKNNFSSDYISSACYPADSTHYVNVSRILESWCVLNFNYSSDLNLKNLLNTQIYKIIGKAEPSQCELEIGDIFFPQTKCNYSNESCSFNGVYFPLNEAKNQFYVKKFSTRAYFWIKIFYYLKKGNLWNFRSVY